MSEGGGGVEIFTCKTEFYCKITVNITVVRPDREQVLEPLKIGTPHINWDTWKKLVMTKNL